ncbi:inosine 5'-monophosphate dehydrogenase [Candidatus Methylomirabilis lanthanidiphila]|uniref:Inosine 5'-monophosphate dehydrogenase n=1 Tax=Candidatus Methylomirabilis lanthanidiphila TaxID=2211376 RepID=A0A564ZKH1_9BACT|nr:CBS and ACT domain-containing protein [Candidatus Methylomirabilis lanthanidiphila]VUZ85804.1 inosine 5'-monophosphate dehydrogenase [Candidatus Methylomirabilis lanthanidiphila]
MRVKDRMRRSLVSVAQSDTLDHALTTLKRFNIRHLPVVKGDHVVGIVSDRDVKKAAPSPFDYPTAEEFRAFTSAVSVKEIMTKEVVTVAPLTPIEEAASLMSQKRIGALPVVQEGRLIGMITETDVLGVMTEMMGATQTASRIEIEIPASPGTLTEVIGIVEGQQIEIASLVTLPAREGARRLLIMRLRTINPDPVVRALEARGYPQVVGEFVS